MTRFDAFLKEALNDPECKAEYDAFADEYEAVQREIEKQHE